MSINIREELDHQSLRLIIAAIQMQPFAILFLETDITGSGEMSVMARRLGRQADELDQTAESICAEAALDLADALLDAHPNYRRYEPTDPPVNPRDAQPAS